MPVYFCNPINNVEIKEQKSNKILNVDLINVNFGGKVEGEPSKTINRPTRILTFRSFLATNEHRYDWADARFRDCDSMTV